ncbi:uncharacterized protein LOC110981889 isoform X2 [Acanthaster planci]|uniref:Uncharacterized protein LOC110981889 isoform X2 n=1 Tax=Acanthaster planci TaxID=133434 RepID=A0A8B7YWA9_ACAPL|nr:uncharacterized protein LOC110981889 isoform X2 [Acanthaster planci]
MQKFAPPSCYTMLMVSALGLIIYNEYLEFYLLKQSQWTRARQSIVDPTGSTANPARMQSGTLHDPVRILFVGDPQIQGYRDEPAILGYITRWDADTYLQKYFQEALGYIQPDVIVTMGDLLDEGSISTDVEFEIYAKRFKELFAVPEYMKSVVIHLSGDNDIGGEGSDPLTEAKIKRFEKHFGPLTEAIHYKHITFFKIDFLPYLHVVGKEKDQILQAELEKMADQSKESTVRIVLSHIGMSSTMLYRHIEVLRTLRPQCAFSAHSHRSGFVKHSLSKLVETFKGVYKIEKRPIADLTPEEQSFVTEEYRIPTCSYRMGVPHMAYAAAVIDESGNLHYALLELPSRFKQLYRYAMFGVFAAIVIVWTFISIRRRR